MKKYYFALFCTLMAATCAMAGPQSGDRIVAAQALTVEWTDAAFRPIMDGASFDMGWQAQLTPSEDENVLVLSGLCDMFDIPMHVDYTTGKAWIETGMPLDAYIDGDVVRTICAMPEQWLIDTEADMNTNLNGSILEDGSIAFDGGVIFLVNESRAAQDLAAAGNASETVWMSSPLFRNMCLLLPNAIHQFSVEYGSDMSLLIPKKPLFIYKASMQEVGRFNFGVLEEQGFKPRKPNWPPPVCNPGSGNNESAATSDESCTLNAINLHVDDNMASLRGFKKKKKDDGHCCSEPGFEDLVVAVASRGLSGGQIAGLRPFDVGDLSGLKVFVDSAGRRPMPPIKPRPCGPDDEVATTRTPGGQVASAPNYENDNIEAGLKPIKQKPPVNGCSEPWWIMLSEMGGFPTRDNSNSNVASSKPADEQFSVPVYVFQNPDDNTIMVYNLYGSGCVMYLNEGQVTPESITWGTTIPYLQDGDISFYFDSNVLTLTDGTQFTVPAAIVKGDLSNDGKVNIADVTKLIDLLLTAGNDGANQVIADVNEDGKINIADVTALIDTLLSRAR